MPAYKDENSNTWYAKIRYIDWTGAQRYTTKRGFKRKKNAQDYETNFKKQQTGTVSMQFNSMYKLYMENARSRVRPTTYQGKIFLFECLIEK